MVMNQVAGVKNFAQLNRVVGNSRHKDKKVFGNLARHIVFLVFLALA